MLAPEETIEAMARFRMVALLGSRLLELAPTAVPGPVREQVESAVLAGEALGQGFELATHRLCGELERRAGPCLALKGQALSRVLHGAAGLRSPGDIDLLVAPEHMRSAIGVLGTLGYRLAANERFAGRRRDLHVVLEPEPGQQVPPVELHWRLHWHDRGFSRHLLATSSVPAGSSMREARLTELVQSTLLFYARDGFAGLRLGADAAAAVERSPVPLPALVSGVEPGLRPHIAAALTVSAQVFGTPPAQAALGPRRRAATRLANWPLAGSVPQMHANVVLVDLLLGPRRSWPAALAALFDVPGVGGAAHLLRTLARFPAALWAIRGGRRWAPPPDPA